MKRPVIGDCLRLSGSVGGMVLTIILGLCGQMEGFASPGERLDQLGFLREEAAFSSGVLHGFVENRGQWPSQVRFLSKKSGGKIQIEETGIRIELSTRKGPLSEVVRLRLAFEGCVRKPVIRGEGPLSGNRSFFVGKNPKEWATTASYETIVYQGLYPGIDLRAYEMQGRLEYDFCVSPGANLADITVDVEGVNSVRVEKDGSLTMHTSMGSIIQSPPITWQVLPGGTKEPIECRFVQRSAKRFGFATDDLDEALPTVIDPVLSWSTFYGGTGALGEEGNEIKSLESGEVVICGKTDSSNIPLQLGYDTSHNQNYDVFVAKFDPDRPPGSQLVWSTVIGGQGYDNAFFECMDILETGEIAIAGQAQSTDFPTTVGAYDTTPTSFGGFLSILSPDGRSLIYSTAIDECWIHSVAWYSPTECAVVGHGRIGYQTTTGSISPSMSGGQGDGCLALIDIRMPGLAGLGYSTFLGGSDDSNEETLISVAVDGEEIVVTGSTRSTDYPTTGGSFSRVSRGSEEIVISRVLPQGNGSSDLLASTYLGGLSRDIARSLLLVEGSVLIVGQTESPNFPVTTTAFDPSHNGANDGFIVRLDSALTRVEYASFLGHTSFDACYAVEREQDEQGRDVYWISGTTSSGGFPVTSSAVQANYQGGTDDGFIVALSPQGSGSGDLVFSTFLGGANRDAIMGLSLAPPCQVFFVGRTISADFPTTFNAYDRTLNGGQYDSVVGCLDLECSPVALCQGIDGENVLFVNGSNAATVSVLSGTPLEFSMQLPSGGGNGRFVAHMNAGPPNANTVTQLPFGLGPVCFPLITSQGSAPVAVFNNLGRENLVGSSSWFGTPLVVSPPTAASQFWFLPTGDPNNMPSGSCFTLQAVIINPNSSSHRSASVTNSVVIKIL